MPPACVLSRVARIKPPPSPDRIARIAKPTGIEPLGAGDYATQHRVREHADEVDGAEKVAQCREDAATIASSCQHPRDEEAERRQPANASRVGYLVQGDVAR